MVTGGNTARVINGCLSRSNAQKAERWWGPYSCPRWQLYISPQADRYYRVIKSVRNNWSQRKSRLS